MSVVKGAIKAVTDILGLSPPKPPAINIPKPQLPAAQPAPTRTDTGANVAIGTTAVKDQRVSGRSSSGGTSGVADILGGLGRGGLSI